MGNEAATSNESSERSSISSRRVPSSAPPFLPASTTDISDGILEVEPQPQPQTATKGPNHDDEKKPHRHEASTVASYKNPATTSMCDKPADPTPGRDQRQTPGNTSNVEDDEESNVDDDEEETVDLRQPPPSKVNQKKKPQRKKLYSHDWIPGDEGADNADKPSKDAQHKLGIFVIGQAGSGKTSLCGLLSGDERIKGVSTAERGNNSVLFVASKYDDNVIFIDTIGTHDDDEYKSDEEILKHALKDVYRAGIRRIKVIWCVSADTTCRDGTFRREARFIQRLENAQVAELEDEQKEADAVSIWNTVLVIKKAGRPSEKAKRWQGVIEASKQYGAQCLIDANFSKHTFGFTCTEWQGFDDEAPGFAGVHCVQQREQNGFFTAKRVREEVEKRLNDLSIYELRFTRDKCTRCGATGDRRYVFAPCHTEKRMFHTQPVAKKHTGEIYYMHPKNARVRTDGVLLFHAGHQKRVHTGRRKKMHREESEEVTVDRVASAVLTLGLTELLYTEQHWRVYKCCNRRQIKAGVGCAFLWTCCKEPNRNVTNCPPSPKIWTCCKQPAHAAGCERHEMTRSVHPCCGKAAGDVGCRYRYTCCKRRAECVRYFPCCGKEFSKQPRSVALGGRVEPEGCVAKCAKCKEPWGEPEGCCKANN